MNKNYVIFSSVGGLISSSFTPISKGNNKVDELYIYFTGFTYNDGYVTVATTLPDRTSLPELSASNCTFVYELNTYNGYKLVISDALTSIAGTLSFTVRLKSNTNDSILCSSQILSLTIHDSDVPSTPTITDAQYDNLTQTISDNYNTLNTNKLNKQFNTYDLASNLDAANDEVILNQSNAPKYAKLDTIYNIKTVNNVSPVNRNISIDADDIPYSETTVDSELDSLNANVESRAYKYQLDEKVGCRDGSLNPTLPSASEVKGLLSYDYTRINDKKAEITLVDQEFQLGDIIQFDMILSGGYRIANGGFVKVINSTDYTDIFNILLVGTNSISYDKLNFKLLDNVLTLEFTNSTAFDGTTQLLISIVRP